VNAAGMAVAENVFNQDLGLAQVRFIPIHPAAKGIHLEPVFSDFSALLFHNTPKLFCHREHRGHREFTKLKSQKKIFGVFIFHDLGVLCALCG
jgi:hypothetical protein